MLSNCPNMLGRCSARREEIALSDWQTIDFFFDESLVEDPYPYFEALRAAGPGARRCPTSAWSP